MGDEKYVGDPEELKGWMRRMNFTYESAAQALGMSRSAFGSLIATDAKQRSRIDYRTALACAAIELGIEPLPGLTVKKGAMCNLRLESTDFLVQTA